MTPDAQLPSIEVRDKEQTPRDHRPIVITMKLNEIYRTTTGNKRFDREETKPHECGVGHKQSLAYACHSRPIFLHQRENYDSQLRSRRHLMANALMAPPHPLPPKALSLFIDASLRFALQASYFGPKRAASAGSTHGIILSLAFNLEGAIQFRRLRTCCR